VGKPAAGALASNCTNLLKNQGPASQKYNGLPEGVGCTYEQTATPDVTVVEPPVQIFTGKAVGSWATPPPCRVMLMCAGYMDLSTRRAKARFAEEGGLPLRRIC
jgi:hypothetical protein